MTTFTFHASARTTVGRRRRNEDTYLLDPSSRVFAVLDGMGGYAGGAEARSIAAATIAEFYRKLRSDPEATWPYALDPQRTIAENCLDEAIRLANRRIRARRRDQFKAMGSTIAMISLDEAGPEALVAHLGDSRIYLLRDGELTQLTRDHSLYEQLRADGLELPPQSEFIHANVITRALGCHENERPELGRVALEAGDRLLLCTDGLSGDLSHQEIAEGLAPGTPDEACETLIAAGYEAGSRDNITALVIDVR